MAKVYVGNLAHSVTSQDLLTLFSKAGEVHGALAISDRASGLCRGFGLVDMVETEDAIGAINLLKRRRTQRASNSYRSRAAAGKPYGGRQICGAAQAVGELSGFNWDPLGGQVEIKKQSPWGTHEFRVKTLDGSTPGAGGARLGRKFSQTPSNNRTWAVNEQGMALDSTVTDRWLSEECVRHPTEMDDDDRKKVRAPV